MIESNILNPVQNKCDSESNDSIYILSKLNVVERIAYKIFNADMTLERYRTALFDRYFYSYFSKINLSPSIISLFGLSFAILASIFLENFLLVSILLLLNLLFDGVDGVIARLSGKDSAFGAMVDISCDTLSNICLTIGLCMFGHITYEVAALYCISLLAYTTISSLKSYFLFQKPVSVGARVLNTSAILFMALLISLNVIKAETFSGFFHYFLPFTSVLLIAQTIQSVVCCYSLVNKRA